MPRGRPKGLKNRKYSYDFKLKIVKDREENHLSWKCRRRRSALPPKGSCRCRSIPGTPPAQSASVGRQAPVSRS